MRYSGDVKKIVWQEGIVFSIEKCESITVLGKALYYSECESICERSWDIKYDKNGRVIIFMHTGFKMSWLAPTTYTWFQ